MPRGHHHDRTGRGLAAPFPPPAHALASSASGVPRAAAALRPHRGKRVRARRHPGSRATKTSPGKQDEA
jgi:hypothetical protein